MYKASPKSGEGIGKRFERRGKREKKYYTTEGRRRKKETRQAKKSREKRKRGERGPGKRGAETRRGWVRVGKADHRERGECSLETGERVE